MKNKTHIWTKFGAMMMIVLATSCLPNEFDDNGLSDENVKAAFTVTSVEGKVNRYLLRAETEGVLGVKWDLGDGAGASLGSTIDTVFYPDAGKYTITLSAIGRGGKTNETSHDVEVLTSDPNSGNLVVGGKMNDGDEASWEIVNISPGVTASIVNGKMVYTGGSWGQAGIYQTVEVVGGKKYKVDMIVSGSGATNTWFEVYVGQAVPVPGTDYSDGGKRLALNTWAGCATAPFNGKLSTLSCDGKDGGTFTFATSGTAYLYIRGGGENLGTTGISIDNVELRGTN